MPIKEIASFSVSYLQILDEDGNVDKELEPKISKDKLLDLYRAMFLAREFDQRMLKLQRQGRIGTFGPCTGHEAAHCAPTLAMSKNDWFAGAFREMGARLMLGETMKQVLLYYNGWEEGCQLPADNKRLLPINIIVGSQTIHATGIGYAMKYRGEKDSAVVAFVGDGGTSEGDFHEGLNFAAVWQVPVVFICQNNQWAISIPRKMQTNSETIAQKGIAYGMPCIQVDGNDPLAMYYAANEALERAHSGGGPSFIEAVTYRLMMHTTADDPTKYRPVEEEEEWWKKEPMIRFRKYLQKKRYWNAKKQAEFEVDIKASIDQAVDEFESGNNFKPDAAFNHVYGTTHPEIEEQRTEFLANIAADKEAANG